MEAYRPQPWAERHFCHAPLGDRRRTRRLVAVAAAFAGGGGGETGGTITSVIRQASQAKAAYRLLDCEQVTHAAVIRGHTQHVLESTATPGHYLLIEDSTAVAFPGLKATTGLGPIGEDFTRGLWAHSTLALRMDWERQQAQVLGLLGQRVWARPPQRPAGRRKSHGKGKESGHARQRREGRESERWMAALQEAQGPLPQTTWTYVADRESDIYELFQRAWLYGWSYVIRATYARALAGAWEGSDLLSAAAQGRKLGQIPLELPRERRSAQLEVRSTRLRLRGPKRPGGRLEDHELNVLHVREVDPPPGQKALCWVLLTDLPVATLAQCLRVLAIYRWRWLIEELHECLKTGLKVEASQLSTARRLAALIGILSVVAVFLLHQKLAARREPEAELQPEQADPVLVQVMRKVDPPRGRPTQGWFWTGIAKLGGFQARKGDGDPGWLTLWRGWQTLMLLTRGYELAAGPGP